MRYKVSAIVATVTLIAVTSSIWVARSRLNDRRRKAAKREIYRIVLNTASLVFKKIPMKLLHSLMGTRKKSKKDKGPRYILKLSSSCSVDERIAGKKIAADALGGEGAIAAIEEGPPLLATILVFDTLHSKNSCSSSSAPSQQVSTTIPHSEDENSVVGIVMLKRGWQDDEFERNVADVVKILTGKKNIHHENLEPIGSHNATTTAGDLLNWLRGNSLLDPALGQMVLSEALRRNLSQPGTTSNPSSKRPPRTAMSSEIVGLAVDPAHRKKKLGGVLANVAAVLGSGMLGMKEIQGSAANPELVPFYLQYCAPPNLKLVERDQFITLDVAVTSATTVSAASETAVASVNRQELNRRWKHKSALCLDGRLPEHVGLDAELNFLLQRAESEPLNGGQVERSKYPL